MSGVSINNSQPLGPTEAPSVEDTGIDLNNESLNPLAKEAHTAVLHQGDGAWRADQVFVPTEQVHRIESKVTAVDGDALQNTTTRSDFQGINEVGEQEYQRALASMRSRGASVPETYAVAAAIRNGVTSVGGTEIERTRESLQEQQAPKPLAVFEPLAQDASIERGLDNGNSLDIEAQFGVVEALKEERVRELTAAAGLDTAVENGLEEALDPELAQKIEAQFEEIREIVNQRQAAIGGDESLSGIQREQLTLGMREEDALTF